MGTLSDAGIVPASDDPRLGVLPHYECEGRAMTPSNIGYEAAAFYRYRSRLGADVENKIEMYPSSQWGQYL